MNAAELQERTYKFALASIEFCRCLPETDEARHFGGQFRRSSASEWSNYRATRRARSKAEFIAKLGNVVEEADESVGWLQLMRDSNIASDPALLAEAQELCAIFTASLSTARNGRR
jgi:four helix bundle protein